MVGRVRIGIDVRALDTASGRRGVGSYIRGLICGLAHALRGGQDEVLLFRHRWAGKDPGLPGAFTAVSLTRPRRAITLWDQIAWPPLLARRRVGVFHSPFYAVPRFRPAACRVVQTIHDLTPLKLPGTVSKRNARLFAANFNLARGADRIIVPSKATKADVVALLKIPEDRIAVVPQGCDITPVDLTRADEEVGRVMEGLRLKERYLLHTGGHDVVKNLPRLLDAFASLVGQGRDLSLVIAGEHGPDTSAVIGRAAMLGLLERVSLPGYVSRQDLVALYRGAAALVYPSYTEGFGLPVLEAMACGTPVVAARAGALPEVGGDACLYADPADAGSIAAAVVRILDEPETAAALSRGGRARAARFTWSETARKTLAVYREAAA